jgi:hypothetical protein
LKENFLQNNIIDFQNSTIKISSMAATVNNNRNIASANPQTSNKNFRISGPISNHPTGGHAGNITVN